MELHMPEESVKLIKEKIGHNGAVAFITTFIVGLLTHMAILTSDIPNHDGLQSMYFNQNMITSGRWFLGTACGISSFYSLPWLIGLLAIIYISLTSIVLVKLLKIESPFIAGLIGAMLVTFPALASNFAYVFTMDGYMLGLLLSVMSVYLVGRSKWGFIFGGIALAFSMGIYQSYLPIAMLLSLFMVCLCLLEDTDLKERFLKALKYLYMGIIGVALYYVILRVLLLIQGKELADYQGINEMAENTNTSLLTTVKTMFSDFIKFVFAGKILFSNVYSLIAVVALTLTVICSLILIFKKKQLFKKPLFYLIAILVALLIPVFTNVILLISPNVTYHLLMRYQYVVFGILALALVDYVERDHKNAVLMWISLAAALVISFSYGVNDNIAYSNLQKKYEKTYAYCLRLADRIEQTEGYYEGIPIYIIGVVGDENFPETDITGDVTGNMIGINGDYLVYSYINYQDFFKYYLGITMNFVDPGIYDFYYEDWYNDIPSFPAVGSTVVKDGVMIVKTENQNH